MRCDFKRHRVSEEVIVDEDSAWFLLYIETFCRVSYAPIVVILKLHSSPSINLNVINTVVDIQGVPANFS